MATPDIISGDLIIQGTLTVVTGENYPAQSIYNAAINAAAAIDATKLIHQNTYKAVQVNGADVASRTEMVHRVYGATGTLVAVYVVPYTAPTGGDKAFTVDVKKSTAAGAPASVLTGVVTVNSASVNYTAQAATISSASAVTGDWYDVVWAATGSTGSQGQGAAVFLVFREAAT